MKSLGKKLPFLVVGTIAVCSVWFVLSSAPADDRGKIQNVVSRFFSLFRSSDREGATVALKAVVYRKAGKFQIQNNDTFPWTNVMVRVDYIGEKGEKDVWGYEADRVDPRHMDEGNLVRVSDGASRYDGARIAVSKLKRIEVRVWADTPSGRGFYAYHY